MYQLEFIFLNYLSLISFHVADAFEIRIVWDNNVAMLTTALAIAGGVVGGYAGGRLGAAVGAGIGGVTGLGVSSEYIEQMTSS